jgi:phosphoglycerol transferase MdoB-like AlkP superfamily enzyme
MYWFTGLLGIAMAIAPFVQGYRDNTMAMWTSIILGVVVLAASIIEGMDVNEGKWEWWVAGVAGILAVIAPFAFGFTSLVAAMWTFIILGIVIVVVAGYEVFFVEQPT